MAMFFSFASFLASSIISCSLAMSRLPVGSSKTMSLGSWAIARAMAQEPKLMVFDEPTGNLDVQASRSICEILKALNSTEKSAILLVTHDPVVAAAAKTVHFIKDGRLASSFDPSGDPAAVSAHYLETYR